ncbi:MAG: DNA-3-methyladenine glycosylase 2 family protein [Candidatus Manganitrophaceae bacterium]|nr:MAG: DNA-3-methyladenine glycosylase 2 family protein [Candidatus Manganitrophaceae bacterium]
MALLRNAADQDHFDAARKALADADPVLSACIEAIGPCRLAPAPDPFVALVEAIISQQLSVKAADTIFDRLASLCPRGPITPKGIFSTPDAALRRVGLSRQKISYMKDLAGRWIAGEIRPKTFHLLPDEEVIARLVEVKGIGRWTAEMFLIFALNRPDVLPVDDLGLKKAVRQAYRLRKLPSPERIQKIAKPWRPYRSIATWYLWKSLNNGPKHPV